MFVFVRHAGWMHCREQVAQMLEAEPEIRDLGAQVVVIATGLWSTLRILPRDIQTRLFLTDPERRPSRPFRSPRNGGMEGGGR